MGCVIGTVAGEVDAEVRKDGAVLAVECIGTVQVYGYMPRFVLWQAYRQAPAKNDLTLNIVVYSLRMCIYLIFKSILCVYYLCETM